MPEQSIGATHDWLTKSGLSWWVRFTSDCQAQILAGLFESIRLFGLLLSLICLQAETFGEGFQPGSGFYKFGKGTK